MARRTSTGSRAHNPAQAGLDFDGWPRLHPDDLTDFCADLYQEAGLEAVRWMLATVGELQVSVPKRFVSVDRLPMWLGEIARGHSVGLVRTIIKLRGGETFRLPSPLKLHDEAIKREIRERYNGRNGGALAREYERSRRFVQRAAVGRDWIEGGS